MEKFLLDPKVPGAFTSEVMHKVVLNGIDFELPENIWDAIDNALSGMLSTMHLAIIGMSKLGMEAGRISIPQ